MKKSWEYITKTLDIEMGAKMKLSIDPEKLREDADRVIQEFELRDYHKSSFGHEDWKFISLVNLNGDLDKDAPLDWKSPPSAYSETKAMEHCPYIQSVLTELGCQTNRVRILSMGAHGFVDWHHEYFRGRQSGLARCHIPIMTHSKTYLQISHQKYAWQPGEIWWGDFAFPHCGYNFGDMPRVYIIADFVKTDEFKRWVPEKYLAEDDRRKKKIARKICYELFRFHRNPLGLKKKLKRLMNRWSASKNGKLEEKRRQGVGTN